jgi:hypothetical protein
MIGRLAIIGHAAHLEVTACTSCGDAGGWIRFGPGWALCGTCNDEAEKPVPPWCGRCGQTFPCCGCPRAKA